MPSPLRTLNVVVVSEEISLLHEVSWVLTTVGYHVETSIDFDAEASWRRYSLADFVIVDSRNVAEPSAGTFAHDSADPLYRLFIYSPSKRTDFDSWYAAGAHDALRTPVSRGELLARLRTGARYLEFERRLQAHSSRCHLPGMYSRRGFLQKLRKLAGAVPQHALLLVSIDWYSGIRRRNGEVASRSLLSSAARAIKRTVGESAISASLGEGRFAALLLGQSSTAAKSVADSLAADFAGRESHHESVPRTTLSMAVVPWTTASTPDQVLVNALDTLDLAEHTGGDCVVVHGEFRNELAAWREEVSTGNPFANVVAQDIMEPFPVLLSRESCQSEVAMALRRSGVPVRPYVDHDGRLVGVGVVESSTTDTNPTDDDLLASESLVTPETIAIDANFTEIYEAFSSRGCAALVVVADDRPLGYITCDGFLSMIDPVHADLFAHTDKSGDELAYLIIPSAVGEPVAAGSAAD